MKKDVKLILQQNAEQFKSIITNEVSKAIENLCKPTVLKSIFNITNLKILFKVILTINIY